MYELENAEAYMAATFPWRDIIKCETILVMKNQKAMEFFAKLI